MPSRMSAADLSAAIHWLHNASLPPILPTEPAMKR